MPTDTVSKYSRIAVDFQAPAAWIKLNNPPVNVIDVPMMEELLVALEELEQRGDMTCILFSGAGKGFSAGVDIAAHTPEKVQGMLTCFHGVIRALVSTKKVTVAAVHGNCLGGGAELALMCDIAYAAPDSKWGFPEIKLACFPPVAAVALSAAVGQKRAAELVLTGKSISGEEAFASGLVSAIGDHLALAVDCVSRLSQLSPTVLALTKKALYAWDAIHFDKGLARAEKIYFDELMHTEDAREGIAAFMEKRQARWSGK
jgi:cyclohexa-1,5-dienecarbonyl-CoA hydratase